MQRLLTGAVFSAVLFAPLVAFAQMPPAISPPPSTQSAPVPAPANDALAAPAAIPVISATPKTDAPADAATAADNANAASTNDANANDPFESQFKNFRDKLKTAKAAGGNALNAVVDASNNGKQDPSNGADLDALTKSLQKNAAASKVPLIPGQNPALGPLGAGGTLPVNGVLPPGAGSLQPTTPEEMQAQVDAQRKKMEDDTFNAALRQLLPLQPEQVRKTLDQFDKSREAAETPIKVAEPKQVVQTISLDPSDPPAIIRMSPGIVTTVTILDATGAPWPIQDVSWAGRFDIMTPEDGGHILRITPQTAHGIGNISIRLIDLVTPITMSLKTGEDEVYYRFDARIPKQGPNAKPSLISYGGLKSVAGKDDQMINILDGTPPADAVKLKVDGADMRSTAYHLNGKTYLRTPLTLLSPGWDSSISSGEGMNVYTIPNAPVILLSDEGRMVRARIAADGEVTTP